MICCVNLKALAKLYMLQGPLKQKPNPYGDGLGSVKKKKKIAIVNDMWL